jgi:voltage-gated potassium channel
MYSLEHEAQPEVFTNAFSGIWWSASTLLTVGYGDIYPVTTMGRVFSIIITFLGVGMVAIPTGIISAGFVEQYQQFKRIGDYGIEQDIHFIRFPVSSKDKWAGRSIRSIGLPQGCLIAAVQRGQDLIIPNGDVILTPGDIITVVNSATGGAGTNSYTNTYKAPGASSYSSITSDGVTITTGGIYYFKSVVTDALDDTSTKEIAVRVPGVG